MALLIFEAVLKVASPLPVAVAVSVVMTVAVAVGKAVLMVVIVIADVAVLTEGVVAVAGRVKFAVEDVDAVGHLNRGVTEDVTGDGTGGVIGDVTVTGDVGGGMDGDVTGDMTEDVAVAVTVAGSEEITPRCIKNTSESPIWSPKPNPCEGIESLVPINSVFCLPSATSLGGAFLVVDAMFLNAIAATLISALVGAINCFEN